LPHHNSIAGAGKQAIATLWRLVLKGSSAIGRALLPPTPFESDEVEHAFRSDHARRSGAQRRVGIFIALFAWIAYSAVDYMNVGPGSGAETLFPKILSLRILGTVAIAIGAFLASRPKFLQDDTYSSRIVCIFVSLCYLLLLGMVVTIEFPFSYVVDYPGLILYVLFVLGLLRIRAKFFLAIIAIALPASAFELYLSNIASIGNSGYLPFKERHAELPFFTNYYYVSAMIYLTSTMIIGYTIACQLERDARATFLRERELERSNQTLMGARRDVENKTLALIAAKEELRTSAERANLEKSKFLADAVHDLSQPAQAVSLLAESARLALERTEFGKAAKLIELTGRAAQIARSSFQAVLEISRLESGLVKPALTVFGVQDFIAEVLAPLEIVAEAKGVKMRVRQTRVDRSMVRSDRALLSRAVANLASNAIKYTDTAKGERQAVLIGVVPLPNRVRIDVIDNGIGIAECKWSEVFRPFVQLHNPEHNREKGLGLGLSIVNAILAVLPEHRLDMRSIEGRGTRFSLYVPRYSGSAFMPIEVGARMGRVADLSSLFIWYVEDDEIARVATGAFLEELGILTEQASSFEELEQELLFTERQPDLVITDYRLPGGRTADDVIAMFVRRWGVDMPVIVLTGEAAHGSGETLGSNVVVLKKPTSPEEIIAAICRLCFK
jgi:signal transduction histidine kinase/CheY-like chemotaxis protein